jgi:Na+-driven multidrug efflux pump
MVILNIILNLIFIPEDINSLGIKLFGLGARGAALATVISYGIGLLYSRIMAYKVTKIKGNYRIIFHSIAAFVMMTFLYLVNNTIVINRWYYLVFFSFIGFGLYLLILTVFKEFSKKDFTFFIDLFNIKKMIEYVTYELRKK